MKQNPKIVEVALELGNVSTLEVFGVHVRKRSGHVRECSGHVREYFGRVRECFGCVRECSDRMLKMILKKA